MESINTTLIWISNLIMLLGLMALFMFAYFQSVKLASLKRQDKISRRDYFAARAPAMPDWFKEMDELKGSPDLPTTAYFTWPWFYAKHMTGG